MHLSLNGFTRRNNSWIVPLCFSMVMLATPASAKVVIGVLAPTEQRVRFVFETKIMTEAAEANGDQIIVQYANESAATQKNQADTMIQRGVDVIVMTAIDATAANALVDAAHAAGIKVITYDRGVTEAKPEFHIARNNYDMGAQQATSALKAQPCGQYAIIRGDRATIAQQDMSRAYADLVESKQCIQVVHDAFVPGWETAGAQREAEAALQAHPDINAFLVMWDTGAQAVVQVLKSAGYDPGKVYVTGADGTPPSLAYIHEGWQGQSTWTPFDQMARDAMNLAHDLGSGLPPRIPGVAVNGVRNVYPTLTNITRDNLCDYITTIAPAGWVNTDEVFGKGVNPCK